jgi:hypothetical protein
LHRQLKSKTWVVYAKRPFGGPAHVIKYLARYTHRVAVSNGRLIEMRNAQVTFRWRDSADGNQQKLMTLAAVDPALRFLGKPQSAASSSVMPFISSGTTGPSLNPLHRSTTTRHGTEMPLLSYRHATHR